MIFKEETFSETNSLDTHEMQVTNEEKINKSDNAVTNKEQNNDGEQMKTNENKKNPMNIEEPNVINLRDRATIKKTLRYKVETFYSECSEPQTYEEAMHSENMEK